MAFERLLERGCPPNSDAYSQAEGTLLWREASIASIDFAEGLDLNARMSGTLKCVGTS